MITPKEILNQDPSIRQTDEFMYWGHTTSLETMLATLEELKAHESLLDLDKAGDERDVAYHAAHVLGRLEPRTVFEHYGDEGLVYVACNASTSDVGERFQDAMADLAGYDKSLFEKARLWEWQKNSSSACRDILSQYAVMEAATGEYLTGVDLQTILRRNTRPGVEVSDARLADYQLLPMRSKDSYAEPAGWEQDWSRDFEPAPHHGHRNTKPFKRFDVWLDAPTGFALAYKGVPQALAAVTCLHRRELLINQLQGVRAKLIDPKKRYGKDAVVGSVASRGLMPFDWQGALVDVAEDLAVKLGLDALAIQGGENNVWRHKHIKGETGPHISAETAMKAYDVPAERLGFTRLADGNWHRQLAS